MIGEESLRITLPMDMKKLHRVSCPLSLSLPVIALPPPFLNLPKRCAGCRHVLAQRPHDTVRTGAVPEDVDRACCL